MKEIIEIVSGIFIKKGENTKSEQIIKNLFEFSKEHQISEFIKFEEMAIKLFTENSNPKNLKFHYESKSEGLFEQCITTIDIFKKGFYLNSYIYTLIILCLKEHQNEREGLTILNFNSKEELKDFLLTDNDVKYDEITPAVEFLELHSD